MERRYWLYLILSIFLQSASADNVTLVYPPNNSPCLTGDHVMLYYSPNDATMTACSLYTNSSGVWNLDIFNSSVTPSVINSFNLSLSSPGSFIWTVKCRDSGNGVYNTSNWSFIVTPAPYCAYLTDTSCTQNISINSNGTLKTRLGNTKGFWLENQDGNIFITNARGEIVKSYDTMMIDAETQIQIDKNGNYINIAKDKTPLTDSQGYYIYSFPVSDSWAWVNDNYTIHAVLNGQEAVCNFTVRIDRLSDYERYDQLGKAAGGMVMFWIILSGLAVYLLRSFYLAWRRG